MVPVLVKGLPLQQHLVFFLLFFRSHPRFEDGDCQEGRPTVHEDVYGFAKIFHLPNEVMKRFLGEISFELEAELAPWPHHAFISAFFAHSDIDMI